MIILMHQYLSSRISWKLHNNLIQQFTKKSGNTEDNPKSIRCKKRLQLHFHFFEKSCCFWQLIHLLENLKLNVLNLALAYDYFIFHIFLLPYSSYNHHCFKTVSTTTYLRFVQGEKASWIRFWNFVTKVVWLISNHVHKCALLCYDLLNIVL